MQAKFARQAQRERNNPLAAGIQGFQQQQEIGKRDEQNAIRNEQLRRELELREQRAAVQAQFMAEQQRVMAQGREFRAQGQADVQSVFGQMQGLGQPVEQGQGGLISPVQPGPASRPFALGDIKPKTPAGQGLIQQALDRAKEAKQQGFENQLKTRKEDRADFEFTEGQIEAARKGNLDERKLNFDILKAQNRDNMTPEQREIHSAKLLQMAATYDLTKAQIEGMKFTIAGRDIRNLLTEAQLEVFGTLKLNEVISLEKAAKTAAEEEVGRATAMAASIGGDAVAQEKVNKAKARHIKRLLKATGSRSGGEQGRLPKGLIEEMKQILESNR